MTSEAQQLGRVQIRMLAEQRRRRFGSLQCDARIGPELHPRREIGVDDRRSGRGESRPFGLFAQHVLGAGRVPVHHQQHPAKDLEIWTGRTEFCRQRIQPPADRHGVVAFKHLAAASRDHGRRSLPRPGFEEVVDGRRRVAPREMPAGGGRADLGRRSGLLGLQAVAQEFSEHRVEAEPLPIPIEGTDEHRLSLQCLEQRRRVVDGEDRLDEFCGHPVEDREAQQQRSPLGRLLGQRLFAQILGDEAIGAPKLTREVLRVVFAAQTETGQHDTGGPSFGPFHHGGQSAGTDRRADDPFEQRRARGLVEGEVALSQLKQRVAESMTTPAEAVVDARGEDEVGVVGNVVGEPPEVGQQR